MKIIADKNIVFLKETFSKLSEVIALPSEQITPRTIKDADVLLVRSVTKVNEKLLKGSKVKFVGTATIGTDHIDTSYLKKAGIKLISAPGSNSNAVAEYVISCLLALAQKHNFHLSKQTIGIIGVGNIGNKVEIKCKALGMKVLLNDPPLKRKLKLGARAPIYPGDRYLPVSALCNADIITLHTPLTYKGRDATYHMVDNKFLSGIKDGTILINTSRGEVIDETALLKHIGRFKAVALDVWENEPDINIELLKKVSMGTPHIAGYSLEGKINATVMLYEELCRFLNRRDIVRNVPLPLSPTAQTLFAPIKGATTISKQKHGNKDPLRSVLSKVYDIEADEHRLRKIITLPQRDRGQYFESLRANYKFRQELMII